MTNFWDEDGDFDYEAHHNATIESAVKKIGRPDLAGEVECFGLQDLPVESFTPELLDAMTSYGRLADQADDPNKWNQEIQDQADAAYEVANDLAEKALEAARNLRNSPAPSTRKRRATEPAMSRREAAEAELRRPWQWNPTPAA